MRILVTGMGGLLAPEVVAVARAWGHESLGLHRRELDVTDARAVEATLRAHTPDAVVHCAAYTNVDRAEAEPALAMRVNRTAAGHVAEACASVGALLVYVSTDYVFGGPREAPWRPDEATCPDNHYGLTKAEGERAVAASGSRHLIARVSWLFGSARPSFVDAMVARAAAGESLRLVHDQFSTPTWSRNAALVLVELLERGSQGIVHVTDGGGAASRLDFALEALRVRGLDVPIDAVPNGTFKEPAVRPPYTVLDVSATEDALERPMPGWRATLGRYLMGEG